MLRILLQKRPIICLDEATSSIDPETNQLLHRALWDFAQDATLVTITHRFENIREYDRVVLVD